MTALHVTDGKAAEVTPPGSRHGIQGLRGRHQCHFTLPVLQQLPRVKLGSTWHCCEPLCSSTTPGLHNCMACPELGRRAAWLQGAEAAAVQGVTQRHSPLHGCRVHANTQHTSWLPCMLKWAAECCSAAWTDQVA